MKWANAEIAMHTKTMEHMSPPGARLMAEHIAHLRALATAAERAGQERRAGAEAMAEAIPPSALCEDCPPVGYPTDKTRCADCPRRALPLEDEV